MEKKYVCDIYNKISYDFNHTRMYVWPWMRDYLDSIAMNNKVLDIGCGNGRNMLYRNYELDMYGIDNCQEFVKLCHSKYLNVKYSDMTYLPYSDNFFDNIICIASFHHLYTHERRVSALQEMKRVLKNGGEICLSVWSKNQPAKTRVVFEKYGDNIVKWCDSKTGVQYDRYYYIFEINELCDLFDLCGLKLVKHYYDCGNEIFILTCVK